MKMCFSNFAMGPFLNRSWSLALVFRGSDLMRYFPPFHCTRPCGATLAQHWLQHVGSARARPKPHRLKPVLPNSPPQLIRVLLYFRGIGLITRPSLAGAQHEGALGSGHCHCNSLT